jgi:signal transduction histidine kinase
LNWEGSHVPQGRKIEEQEALLEDKQRLLTLLEHKQALLDTIIQQIPAGIIARDAKTAELLISNARFQEMMGCASPLSLTALETSNPIRHMDGRLYTREELPIARAIAGETIVAEEFLMMRADQSEGVFRCSANPVRNASGEIVAGALSLVDVTDHKRHERERVSLLAAESAARADAENASRAKDEFLATASHELRTPLNAILGWAQLLRTGQLDAAAQVRALETIERNGRVQVRLIEDILDGSRIITGNLHLELKTFRVDEIIRAALDTVRPSAEARQIRLTASLAEEHGSVVGDPERVQQVLWNLLSNAIKFTPKGGAVTIACTAPADDDVVEIVIADDGQGIAPDFLPHVFERFRQAEATTTRRHGGLGLGLALVRHLVEAHGGTVRVESQGLGAGSTFFIRLPRTAISAEAPAGDNLDVTVAEQVAVIAVSPSALQGITALVVDDEADARDLIAAILRGKGAIVTTASSAAEGFTKLVQEEPMVLLSDIAMPDVDGYAYLARVRTEGGVACAGTPAIAITAYAREEDRRKALAAGFQAHLAKPVDPDALIRIIVRLLVQFVAK